MPRIDEVEIQKGMGHVDLYVEKTFIDTYHPSDGQRCTNMRITYTVRNGLPPGRSVIFQPFLTLRQVVLQPSAASRFKDILSIADARLLSMMETGRISTAAICPGTFRSSPKPADIVFQCTHMADLMSSLPIR